MPFYKEEKYTDTTLLFWKYSKKDIFDIQQLTQKEDLEKIKNYPPKKLQEYLMIRQMLHDKLPNHKILYKDNGEPFLSPHDAEISITHSFPFAVLAISKEKIGIDLEKINPKIEKIKHKFLHQNELQWAKDLEQLTIIWTIKEALYKLHHAKYWALYKHYEVQPFSLNDNEIHCSVLDNDNRENFLATISKIENYFFCRVEKKPPQKILR